MLKHKLRTVCCLVIFCAGVNVSALPQRSPPHRHTVVRETINDVSVFYNENWVGSERHVKGRSAVNSNDFQSLHRSSDSNKKWSRGPARSSEDIMVAGMASPAAAVPSSESHRKMEKFMEEFYLKQLRIEMQRSQILHSFPPDELPAVILAQRDQNAPISEESAAAIQSNRVFPSEEQEDNDDDTKDDNQELLEFMRQVSSSMEEKEAPENNELDAEQDESAVVASDSWLSYFRPIYRFIKDNMARFEKELREHKRKMERVWKQVQEERNALEREEGDEPFDVLDFEHEAEHREIIFLDEVDCEHVFKGYYPTSPPTFKEYLDFCLQIDRNKFKGMVEPSANHSESNSVSELPQLQIQKAELWFYKSNADAMDSHNQMFSLKSIDNWDVEGKYKKFETISLKQSPTTVGWITADVSAPLVEWLSPMAFATLHKTSHRIRNTAYHKKRNLDAYFTWKKNFGHTSKHKFFLNVSCRTCTGGGEGDGSLTENRTSTASSNTETGHRPLLVIDYKRIDPSRHGKRMRGIGGESRNRRDRRNLICTLSSKDCCRERLWIEFKENGMDFIINPKGYYANYCRGDCNQAADNAVRSAHNSLVSLYAQSHPAHARRLGIKTCCSATEYESLSVMYLNQNNLPSNRTFNNLIVKSCGCN